MAVLDLARLRADTAEFKPKPYPEDAQPMSVIGQSRIGTLPEDFRPGCLVSCRPENMVEVPAAARFRTQIHMFYYGEAGGNRFRFKLHKNPFGHGVAAIPVMRNLLEHLSDWEYEEDEGGFGYITTDIVGMIYLKANFP